MSSQNETNTTMPAEAGMPQSVEAKINARAQPLIPINGTLQAQLAKRGIVEAQWNTLKLALFPGAADESVLMMLDYCKARSLDPFKKPVHIVPIWSTKEGKLVDTIWPGITEVRITAMRTKQYAGKDETVFGEEITHKWAPADKRKVEVEVVLPKWAQVTVYRVVAGERVAFVGPKVYWLESYATKSRNDPAPNDMWENRPYGQLDKCAEAAALRAAFPEEVGNMLVSEEAKPFGGMRDVTPTTAPTQSMADLLAAEAKAEATTVHEGQAVDVSPDAAAETNSDTSGDDTKGDFSSPDLHGGEVPAKT